MRKEERWRLEGISYAINFLKSHDGDIKALEEDAKRRGALEIPVGVTRTQLDEFSDRIRHNCTMTMALVAISVLHDEFGFSNKQQAGKKGRLDRFIDRFNQKAECLESDYVSWEELRQTIMEECGVNYEEVKFL